MKFDANCLICNSAITQETECYGLAAGGKQIIVKKAKNNNFFTLNGVPFTVLKSKWYTNPNRCFGTVVHKTCHKLLQDKLNLDLKLEDVAKYIRLDDNVLKNTKYGTNERLTKSKIHSKSNQRRILSVWINFTTYNKNTVQRKECVNKIKKNRKLQYLRFSDSNSQVCVKNRKHSQ